MAMTMRERLAIAALCGWNNVPRDNAVMLAEWQKRCVEPGNQPTRQAWERVVDAVLEQLTANPGVDVLDAARGAPTQDENGINCFEIMTTGEAFCAMIRAIKDGK